MGGPRLVQWSRFSDAWQRLFGIQGASGLNVVDDVFLTLPVEDDLLHLSTLRGWRPFASRSAPAASVGNFTTARFGPTPGQLMVIEGFIVQNPAANGQLNIGIITTAGGPSTVLPDFARDSRARAGTCVRVSTTAAVGAVVTAPALTVVCLGNQPAPAFHVPFVVTSDFDLVFEGSVVNFGFTVSVWGRYRELTAQES